MPRSPATGDRSRVDERTVIGMRTAAVVCVAGMVVTLIGVFMGVAAALRDWVVVVWGAQVVCVLGVVGLATGIVWATVMLGRGSDGRGRDA